MELPLRTLKFGVDAGRKAHDFLTNVDLDSQIETAGLKAGQHVADDHDDLDPRGVHDLIVLALEDSDELADGVDELIQRGEPVAAETALLAEELARLADGFDPLAAVSTEAVDWEAVAETFLETFEREVAAMEADQRWFLLQAYNQRVLETVTPDEFTQARDALNVQDFNWLDESDFAGAVTEPELVWRRPFGWKHVKEYTIERRRGGTGEPFVQEVRETLANGGHQLIVGPPGSGKTTACKQIAAEWYDDDETGPVLYRESGGTGSPVDPEDLAEAVETATELGETLVVVEDAVRQDSVDVFRFAAAVENRSDVSILVDAREHEWDAVDDRIADSERGTGVQRLASDYSRLVDRTRVPYLSAAAIESLFETFLEKTDVDPTILPDPQRVFERLVTVESRQEQREAEPEQTETDDSNGASATTEESGVTEIEPATVRSTVGGDSVVSVASPMLLLSYYLPAAGSDGVDLLDDTESDDTVPSPLEYRVRQVFRQLCPDEDPEPNGPVDATPLSEQVGLLSGVLSAADVPLRKEFFYTLADDRDEYRTIRRLLDAYRGWIHFGDKSTNTLYAPHELWGLTYLYVHEDEAMDATWSFAQCVNTVFSLFDDESAWERATAYGDIDGETELATALEAEDAATAADSVVSRVFQVGTDRPALVSLFTGERDAQLTLPECCSGATKANTALYRARMFRSTGETEQWVRGLRESRQTAEQYQLNTTGIQSVFYSGLSSYARRAGEYDAAERLEQLSLECSRERDDESGEAASLGSLGDIALQRGEFGEAEQYHEQSLSIKQEIDDRSGEANSLGSLGNIALQRGEFAEAEQYHEQSLSIFEEIGDRSGEATSLHSLGNIARSRGEFAEAEQYHERSLSIFEEIGDRSGEAKSLGSLGNIAFQRGEFAEAEQYHERSLSIKQEIGDRSGEAKSLHSLGTIALQRGEFAEAEQYHERSLSIFEEIGDRSGEAKSLGSLGNIAAQRGEFDAAEEHHKRSLSIKQKIGDRSGEAASLGSLGNIARSRGEFETAKNRYQSALATFAELGQMREEIQALQDLVRTAEGLDDEAAAVEWVERGLTQLDGLDLAGLDEEQRWFEIRSVRLDGDEDDLEGLYRTALERLEAGEFEVAVDLLEGVWDCRTSFASETDAHEICLRAGVGYAAPMLQYDSDAAADVIDTVREAVESHPDRLSEPAAALHDLLVDGATDHDPDALREAADGEEPTLVDLERFAYADLLEQLVVESKPLEIYVPTIRAIAAKEAEFEEIVNSCLAAWDQHTDVEGDQYRAALAAGVVLEACREFADDPPRDRESVFGVVREHRELLSEPIEALFEYLDTGATDHDPDALREAADGEEPTLVDLERIAVAGLLTAFQSQ